MFSVMVCIAWLVPMNVGCCSFGFKAACSCGFSSAGGLFNGSVIVSPVRVCHSEGMSSYFM